MNEIDLTARVVTFLTCKWWRLPNEATAIFVLTSLIMWSYYLNSGCVYDLITLFASCYCFFFSLQDNLSTQILQFHTFDDSSFSTIYYIHINFCLRFHVWRINRCHILFLKQKLSYIFPWVSNIPIFSLVLLRRQKELLLNL